MYRLFLFLLIFPSCVQKLGDTPYIDSSGLSDSDKIFWIKAYKERIFLEKNTYTHYMLRKYVGAMDTMIKSRVPQGCWRSLSNLSLNLVKDRAGLGDAYLHCTRGKKTLPSTFGSAFFCGRDDEIHQQETELISATFTYDHEEGHYQSDANGIVSEFPAEANKIWKAVLRLGIDVDFGLLFTHRFFDVWLYPEVDSKDIEGFGKYKAASLYFVLAANRSSDIDHAACAVFTADETTLKQRYNEWIEEYPEWYTMTEIWAKEVKTLLNKNSFLKYMAKLIKDTTPEWSITKELIYFMKVETNLKLLELYLANGSYPEEPYNAWCLSSQVLVNHGMTFGFSNKMIKNKAIDSLTLCERTRVVRKMNINAYLELEKFLLLEQSLLYLEEINREYPCEYDFYYCEAPFSLPRVDHANLFFVLWKLYTSFANQSFNIDGNKLEAFVLGEKAFDVKRRVEKTFAGWEESSPMIKNLFIYFKTQAYHLCTMLYGWSRQDGWDYMERYEKMCRELGGHD